MSDSKDKKKNITVENPDTPPESPANTPPIIHHVNPKSGNRENNIFSYIGPTITGGRLSHGIVLRGTLKQITASFKREIELYPDIVRLIVPVSKLSESRRKVKSDGNSLNECYLKIERSLSHE
ncbi:MAG: hypothetical protein FWF82_03655 [Oscillospiraceae bacterium]|nr:hypothetical protein [Oscillospiraceae bacterium]